MKFVAGEASAAAQPLAMKTIFFLMALLFSQHPARAGIESDIPATNRVVLNSGDWTPTAEQTQKVLLSIQSFFDEPNTTNQWQKTQIRDILTNAKAYRVQFVGVTHEGRKLIWCNFFDLGNGDMFRLLKVD